MENLKFMFLLTMPVKLVHNKSSHQNKGYLLVETMVAVMIVTVGLLGIFSLLSRSLSLNRVVGDNFRAAYLSAEGIEIVKNIIDNNLIAERPWNYRISDGNYEISYEDFLLQPNQNRFLNYNPVSGFYSYNEDRPTNFQRVISINVSEDGQKIAVGSKVKWITRGGGRSEINLEDHFLNWRQ